MKYTLLSALLATSPIAFSQNQEIVEWQNQHKTVLFIEINDYANLNNEKKELLGDNVIVYQETITLSDIEAYTNSRSNQLNKSTLIDQSSPNGDQVKSWLAKHSDLKYISNEYFSNLNHDEQQDYLEADALIYNGEYISFEDIENYIESH